MTPEERISRHQSASCWEHPEFQDDHEMCSDLSQTEIRAREEFLSQFHSTLTEKDAE